MKNVVDITGNIIKAIQAREFGEVRSMLDEYDAILQRSHECMMLIYDELRNIRDEVTFERISAGNWTYVEAELTHAAE
ncbi:hypothetical protein WE348_21435 (plasmid) [Alteromonas macleodii]|uniref:hypothetical protein n=1 Tax=Alteromonas macleodii TaxID=28108 RepID=UPI0030CD505F